VRAGLGDERAASGDLGLAPPDGFFIEARRLEIAKNVWLVLEAGESDRDSRIEGINSMHGGFLDLWTAAASLRAIFAAHPIYLGSSKLSS
jgi:hypothetical protein